MRTDFFTRPPRVTATALQQLWQEQDGRDPPFTNASVLAAMKMTGRAKDWPFVGELARLVDSKREQFLLSQSARDLVGLAQRAPELARELSTLRPAIASLARGEEAVEDEIDRERRQRMDADRRRIGAYVAASAEFARVWAQSAGRLAGLPLHRAHSIVVEWGATCLPMCPPDLEDPLHPGRATNS